MSKGRTLRLVALALALVGCGLQTLELAPAQGDVILLEPVPAAAIALLQQADDGAKPEPKLALSYPSDGCAIPQNLAPLTFLYGEEKKEMVEPPKEPAKEPKEPPKDAYVAYELRVRAGDVALRLYTTATNASVPAERWQALLAQHEGDDLEISLRALQASNKVSVGKPVHLRVLAATQGETFAYWSDRQSAAVATRISGAAAGAPPLGYPALDPWFSASADGTREASARDGLLSVRERGTPLALAWAEAWRVDMPSFAPAGNALAFVASSTNGAAMMGMMGMMMPPAMALPNQLLISQVRDASVGEPTVALTLSEADQSLRSPVYSPDARFLAFERLKGRDKAGTLWLLPADGAEPEALARKMGWPGDGAFPTWLASRAADEHWLVFSRARGPGPGKPADDVLQLWAVALRSTPEGKLELLGDPFWWPGQEPDARNRRLLKAD